MRRFRLHLFVFGAFILMILIGIPLSPGATGALLGATLGAITDPALFVSAVVLGFAFLQHTLLLTATLVVAGIGLSVWIFITNADLGARLTYPLIFLRVLSFLLIGVLSNAIAQLIMIYHEHRSSDRSSESSH